jgi:hypothetical protein
MLKDIFWSAKSYPFPLNASFFILSTSSSLPLNLTLISFNRKMPALKSYFTSAPFVHMDASTPNFAIVAPGQKTFPIYNTLRR